jgi:alkanesulfonate monooxygenase SsuD/methylene tetrahydromethanopterin reductase-like flavin-dependent oxidoreductase (luciferase family)
LDDAAITVSDAVLAESRGFDFVACGEHLFFHGPTPNSFISLAAAAGATKAIRLVSTITLLPQYPAALAASLDVVSGGRFELGIGAGGEYAEEFKAVGVPLETRFRRIDEAIEVMRRLFTGGTQTFEGTFTKFSGITLAPAPVQPGGPPLWMGGRNSGALRRAGKYASVWMPYMVTPSALRSGLAEVREHAVAADRRAEDVDGAVFLWACVDRDAAWARQEGVGRVSTVYQQDFAPLADKYLLVGGPDQCRERIEEYCQAGARRIVLAAACGPQHRERIHENFASLLLPTS